VKALFEKLDGLPFSVFVGFVFTHQDFNLLGKQSTDGSIPAGGENLRFAKSWPAETYRDILLAGISLGGHIAFFT
jgi:hypothetical protein